MTKNLILGLILACLAQIWVQKFFFVVLPLLNASHCCKLLLHAISRKTNNPNSRKWQKTSFLVWFRSVGPKIQAAIFFPKIWLRQSLAIKVSYHHVQNQKKNNDLILKKLSEEWKDGQTDRWTREIS